MYIYLFLSSLDIYVAHSDEMVRQTASRALFGVGEDRSAHGRLVQLPVGEKIAVFEHLLVYLIDKVR